jgi:hypothetical protein
MRKAARMQKHGMEPLETLLVNRQRLRQVLQRHVCASSATDLGHYMLTGGAGVCAAYCVTSSWHLLQPTGLRVLNIYSWPSVYESMLIHDAQ